MRVALGRGEAGMSQKLLNRTQIGASLEEMGRKAVAERMGALSLIHI